MKRLSVNINSISICTIVTFLIELHLIFFSLFSRKDAPEPDAEPGEGDEDATVEGEEGGGGEGGEVAIAE